MNTHSKLAIGLGLAALVIGLGACSSRPTQTERNFGDSVRQMVRAQVYDPGTLSQPSEEAIESTDGQHLEGALEAYRGDSAQRGDVGTALEVGAGEGR